MSDLLLDHALDWIDRHLDAFDPLWKPDRFDFERGQRLGELAILVRSLARTAGGSEDRRLHRMSDVLRRTQASPVYRDRVLRTPVEFMLFLQTYSTLRALGLDDEPMRARLQKAIRQGWLNQTERFPHREMDIRSCLDACGIECDSPPLDELYRRSILGTSPNPVLLGEHDLYALTHVIMFLCDFGSRPPDAMPRAHLEPVAALLSALMVVAARERHWDLLAEFLLCWSCLELPETTLVEKAWEALERAQRGDGAVPGPEAEGEALPFEHLYHTTLVCALAASIRQVKIRPRSRLRPRPEPELGCAGAERGLKDVAERAAGFLTATVERELQGGTPSALRLSQGLVGLRCCSVLADTAAPVAIISRIVRGLSHAASGAEWQALPPLLQCVSAAWAAEAAVTLPALHAEDGFLRRASAALAAMSTQARSVPELSEAWSALHQLGMAPAPPTIPEGELASRAARVGLDDDPRRIEELLQLIEASTASGTRRAALAGDAAWVSQLVAGLSLDACRRYDLLKAASLLRVAAWMEPTDACSRHVLETCARYLAFNQREDGAFGLLGPDLASRREALGPAADDDDCFLPLSVSCVLALAEHYRGWRLVGELGTLNSRLVRPRPRGTRAGLQA